VARECFDFLFQGYPIVAHNFSFDARMLSQQVDPSKWPREIFTLCTMQLARKNGHKGQGKLVQLAEHYNLEYGKEHAAVDDAIVTGHLARRLGGSKTVQDLHTKTTGDWADSYITSRAKSGR
jgi:DNA polymerase III alpha subunit (gram-positive type)